MKASLRVLIFFIIICNFGFIVQAQEANEPSLLSPIGIVLAFAVVGVMAYLLYNFVRQLWQDAKREKSQAVTEQSPYVVSADDFPESIITHQPLPSDSSESPTMILELVKSSLASMKEGQQWFITESRTPFLIGSGKDESQTVDIKLESEAVEIVHAKISFDAVSQAFLITVQGNYTWDEVPKVSGTSHFVPHNKGAMLEISGGFVFRVQQVRGESSPSTIAQRESELSEALNIRDMDATSREPATNDADVVETSRLPDASEFDEPSPKASTGEVATLQDAPDMSTLPNVRYPLQNVDFPPLLRLPDEVDAMIEVIQSPKTQANSYAISRTVYKIGRSDKTDLRLPHGLISNNHLALYWAKDRYWVVDTSLNQTWIKAGEIENVLVRGNPVPLDANQEYYFTLANSETLLRFRYLVGNSQAPASDITLPPLPAGIDVKLRMVKVGASEEVQEFEVNSNRITIGRETNNMVRLTPQVISRRHAEIVWKADAYYLEDKRSLYHIMLNGEMVNSGEEHRLEADKVHKIVLSPKQKDAVHLEFSYSKA